MAVHSGDLVRDCIYSVGDTVAIRGIYSPVMTVLTTSLSVAGDQHPKSGEKKWRVQTIWFDANNQVQTHSFPEHILVYTTI